MLEMTRSIRYAASIFRRAVDIERWEAIPRILEPHIRRHSRLVSHGFLYARAIAYEMYGDIVRLWTRCETAAKHNLFSDNAARRPTYSCVVSAKSPFAASTIVHVSPRSIRFE